MEEKSESITVTSPVKVPANSAIIAQVLVQHTKIDVPFRAVHEVTYADGSTREVVTSGVYNQVAFYSANSEFHAEEAGKPAITTHSISCRACPARHVAQEQALFASLESSGPLVIPIDSRDPLGVRLHDHRIPTVQPHGLDLHANVVLEIERVIEQ